MGAAFGASFQLGVWRFSLAACAQDDAHGQRHDDLDSDDDDGRRVSLVDEALGAATVSREREAAGVPGDRRRSVRARPGRPPDAESSAFGIDLLGLVAAYLMCGVPFEADAAPTASADARAGAGRPGRRSRERSRGSSSSSGSAHSGDTDGTGASDDSRPAAWRTPRTRVAVAIGSDRVHVPAHPWDNVDRVRGRVFEYLARHDAVVGGPVGSVHFGGLSGRAVCPVDAYVRLCPTDACDCFFRDDDLLPADCFGGTGAVSLFVPALTERFLAEAAGAPGADSDDEVQGWIARRSRDVVHHAHAWHRAPVVDAGAGVSIADGLVGAGTARARPALLPSPRRRGSVSPRVAGVGFALLSWPAEAAAFLALGRAPRAILMPGKLHAPMLAVSPWSIPPSHALLVAAAALVAGCVGSWWRTRRRARRTSALAARPPPAPPRPSLAEATAALAARAPPAPPPPSLAEAVAAAVPYVVPVEDGSASPRVDFAVRAGSPWRAAARSRTPSPSASEYGDTAAVRATCAAALAAQLDEAVARERRALWLRWHAEQLERPVVEPRIAGRIALNAARALEADRRRRMARARDRRIHEPGGGDDAETPLEAAFAEAADAATAAPPGRRKRRRGCRGGRGRGGGAGALAQALLGALLLEPADALRLRACAAPLQHFATGARARALAHVPGYRGNGDAGTGCRTPRDSVLPGRFQAVAAVLRPSRRRRSAPRGAGTAAPKGARRQSGDDTCGRFAARAGVPAALRKAGRGAGARASRALAPLAP